MQESTSMLGVILNPEAGGRLTAQGERLGTMYGLRNELCDHQSALSNKWTSLGQDQNLTQLGIENVKAPNPVDRRN